MDVFVQETQDEASNLSGIQGNTFILIGSTRAAFTHGKGVFAMVCELLKAFEVDAFKVINDRNAWDFFDIARADTCQVSQVGTPVLSLVGNIGVDLQELKGAAQIAHARLGCLRLTTLFPCPINENGIVLSVRSSINEGLEDATHRCIPAELQLTPLEGLIYCPSFLKRALGSMMEDPCTKDEN
jgi:hypothetical protein